MGRMRSLLIPGVDKKLLVKDAVKVMPDLTRRRFISGGASLGALTLLTGCDVLDSDSADRLLHRSRNSTTPCRPGCSIPTRWRRPSQRAR